MSDLDARLKERMKVLYASVRNNRPDLYERAVEIGHLALSSFIRDENKRAEAVEGAVMSLVAELAEITVEPRFPTHE